MHRGHEVAETSIITFPDSQHTKDLAKLVKKTDICKGGMSGQRDWREDR